MRNPQVLHLDALEGFKETRAPCHTTFHPQKLLLLFL